MGKISGVIYKPTFRQNDFNHYLAFLKIYWSVQFKYNDYETLSTPSPILRGSPVSF